MLRRGKLKNNKIEDSGRIHHFSILQNTPGPRNTAKAESNPLEDFSLLMQYELLKTLIVQHTKTLKVSLFTNYFQSLFPIYLFKVDKTYNKSLFTIK